MIFFLSLILIAAGYFMIRKMPSNSFLLPIVFTLLYWWWESHVGGNIRIDLFIIYPLMFLVYFKAFERSNRTSALLISSFLMACNFVFCLLSYWMFNKSVG